MGAVARQRIERQDGSASATAERELLDPTTDAFVRASGPAPGQLIAGLQHADPSTRARAVQRLQAGIGNAAVGSMLGSAPAEAPRDLHIERRRGRRRVARPPSSARKGTLPSDGAVALDTSAAAWRRERDHRTAHSRRATRSRRAVWRTCWRPSAVARRLDKSAGSRNPTTRPAPPPRSIRPRSTWTSPSRCPSWTPPATMLPKAKAEWTRWYAALDAHEQGHVTKVHGVYEGAGQRDDRQDARWRGHDIEHRERLDAAQERRVRQGQRPRPLKAGPSWTSASRRSSWTRKRRRRPRRPSHRATRRPYRTCPATSSGQPAAYDRAVTAALPVAAGATVCAHHRGAHLTAVRVPTAARAAAGPGCGRGRPRAGPRPRLDARRGHRVRGTPGTGGECGARGIRARGGKPIIVIGHSGGGSLARLAMSDVAYRGRATAVAPLVGCLVTLGTPHACTSRPPACATKASSSASSWSSRTRVPGSRRTTGYVTVASDAVRPRAARIAAASPDATADCGRSVGSAGRSSSVIVGTLLPTGSDGVVSVEWAHLSGATNLTYHDVLSRGARRALVRRRGHRGPVVARGRGRLARGLRGSSHARQLIRPGRPPGPAPPRRRGSRKPVHRASGTPRLGWPRRRRVPHGEATRRSRSHRARASAR